MDRPVLFLDVDGVLNRIVRHKENARHDSWGDWFKHRILVDRLPLMVILSKSMASALAALPVEIRWLTTWEHHAPKLLAPVLGLPEYEVAGGVPADRKDESLYVVRSPNWKLDVILNTMSHDKTRPIIWIDDEANDEDAEEALLDAGHTNLLIVRCDEREGYTPEDHARVEAYLTLLAAR